MTSITSQRSQTKVLFILCKNCMMAHKENQCPRCGLNFHKNRDNYNSYSAIDPVSGSVYISTNTCKRRIKSFL